MKNNTNYINNNKELIKKYILIILANIIIYILGNFYFKNLEYKDILIFLLILIVSTVIYFYKGTKIFKYELDIISNLITGLLLLPFIKKDIDYSTILFTIFFANNIVYMKSRASEKLLRRSFQYLSILLITVISMIINIAIFTVIK